MQLDIFVISSLVSATISFVVFVLMLWHWKIPIARTLALLAISSSFWELLLLLGGMDLLPSHYYLLAWKMIFVLTAICVFSLSIVIAQYFERKPLRLFVIGMAALTSLYATVMFGTNLLILKAGAIEGLSLPVTFGAWGLAVPVIHLIPVFYIGFILLSEFTQKRSQQARRDATLMALGILLPTAILIISSIVMPLLNLPNIRSSPISIIGLIMIYWMVISQKEILSIRIGIRLKIILSVLFVTFLIMALVNLSIAHSLPRLLARNLSPDQTFQALSRMFGWIEFAGIIIVLAVISLIADSIARPISVLSEKLRLIHSGKFKGSVATNSLDEIGDLSRSTDVLLSQLQEERDSVSAKVKDQTSALSSQIVETEKTKRALLNVLEDLYEEKLASEGLAADLKKFQLAVENASDHIIITDPDGYILYANRAAEIITGYSRREILGTKAGALWGKRMPQEYYQRMWHTIKTEKKTFTGNINNHRKNGQDYIAESSITPILDKNGEVKFFVGIERDITKAVEVDRMKTEFISLASHQMRTPLSAMRWFSELLLEDNAGKLNDEQRNYVESIQQSNERLIELVNSLLDISRIESGRLTIEPLPTKLGDLVRQAVTTLDQQIKAKQIEIKLELPELTPIVVDPKLVSQVYLNLITNAVKYTNENGKVAVTISESPTEIISEIKDTGVGIPHNQLHRVFERFFRGDNVMKTSPGGTGLGLYLAKTIVEASGGRIWFDSKENEGTTFWFSLPKSGSPAHQGEVTLTGAE